jgi:hypothetical protein
LSSIATVRRTPAALLVMLQGSSAACGRSDARRAPQFVKAVGKSCGGVSLVPDLVVDPKRGSDGAAAGGEAVVVELQQVVRGRDEPPFASAGRPAPPLEASDRGGST